MKRTIFSISTIFLVISTALSALSTSISYDAQSFLINGKRTFIFSGEFHYWRIPRAEWPERIERIKAAGINAVSTPVPWACHENKPGQIDLSDFEDFLKTCHRHGLFVIARIGPVTGADFEFRGLPCWLIAIEVPGIDTDSELYLRYAARWYNSVCPLVARYQITNGGPIILVQIDNEYENTLGKPSSADPSHLRTLARAARERGIEVPLYINYRLWPPADVPDLLTALDIFPAWNLDSLRSALSRHREKWPDRPLSIAEFGLFRDCAIVGQPLPELPDDISAAYRANVLTLLSNGACFINHYTISGAWSFAYGHRRDIGHIYYPNAPLTLTGGFNDTYWPLRLTGQWLNSFASDFLTARELPPDAAQPVPLQAGPRATAGKGALDVQIRAFASRQTGYIFLHEPNGKPAAFRLGIENLSAPGSLSIPIEGKILLSPRQSKLLMTGIEIGNLTVFYSTSEISTRAALGRLHYAIFHGDENTPGEILLTAKQPPAHISDSIRLTREPPVLRLNYTHSPQDQFVRFDNALLVITTTERAARTWRIGTGKQSALLFTDADLAKDSQATRPGRGIETTLLCKPGTTRVSAFFPERPNRILLDGKKVPFSFADTLHRFTIKTRSAPSVHIRLRRAKSASESSLPERKCPFVKIADLSKLARSGFYSPGFIRLRTTVPKNAINSISIETNATPPPILHVNQNPVSGERENQGASTFDLRGEIGNDHNQLHLTLEFQAVPQLHITTTPQTDLQWEASPGLKGEWLLLFARPHGPEWKRVRLPEKPTPNDITWFALPFTLHPKAAWEQPLSLKVEAGDQAFLWLNGRRFARYTSRGPENVFPLPSSWLLDGQNLLVIAARGTRPVTAEIASDDAHSLMHRKLEVEW